MWFYVCYTRTVPNVTDREKSNLFSQSARKLVNFCVYVVLKNARLQSICRPRVNAADTITPQWKCCWRRGWWGRLRCPSVARLRSTRGPTDCYDAEITGKLLELHVAWRANNNDKIQIYSVCIRAQSDRCEAVNSSRASCREEDMGHCGAYRQSTPDWMNKWNAWRLKQWMNQCISGSRQRTSRSFASKKTLRNRMIPTALIARTWHRTCRFILLFYRSILMHLTSNRFWTLCIRGGNNQRPLDTILLQF